MQSESDVTSTDELDIDLEGQHEGLVTSSDLSGDDHKKKMKVAGMSRSSLDISVGSEVWGTNEELSDKLEMSTTQDEFNAVKYGRELGVEVESLSSKHDELVDQGLYSETETNYSKEDSSVRHDESTADT